MARLACLFFAVLLAPAGFAGERIVGTNSYVLNEDVWHVENSTYWRQDNYGAFDFTEGPIDPSFVQCIGAGFGDASGVRGEGTAISKIASEYTARQHRVTTWQGEITLPE